MANPRAVLVCTSHYGRHRGPDFWQAAQFLSVHLARVAGPARLAAYALADHLCGRDFLSLDHRRGAYARWTSQPPCHFTLAKLLRHLWVSVAHPRGIRVHQPLRAIVRQSYD